MEPEKIITHLEDQGCSKKEKFDIIQVDDFLQIKSEESIKYISIADISGRYVFHKNYSDSYEVIIPVDTVPCGVYIVRVNNNYEQKSIIQ